MVNLNLLTACSILKRFAESQAMSIISQTMIVGIQYEHTFIQAAAPSTIVSEVFENSKFCYVCKCLKENFVMV